MGINCPDVPYDQSVIDVGFKFNWVVASVRVWDPGSIPGSCHYSTGYQPEPSLGKSFTHIASPIQKGRVFGA